MTGTIRAAARPRLWIVAGPNGSGKSSAYDQSDVGEFGGSVWIINPDLLTVRIRDVERMTQTEANLAAVQRIEHWLDASIDTHQTIGVETVLSSPKYRRVVERAKRMSFEVRLIYVFLRSAELQMQRIAGGSPRAGMPCRRTRCARDVSGRSTSYLGSSTRRMRPGSTTTPAMSRSWWGRRTGACFG